MDTVDIKEFGAGLLKWFNSAECTYWLYDYAIQYGVSKQELERMALEDEEFSKILDLAYTIQECSMAKKALNGLVDKTVAIKALETYHGWKQDAKVVNQNVFQRYASEAADRASKISDELYMDTDSTSQAPMQVVDSSTDYDPSE
jgi:hypothetical protein